MHLMFQNRFFDRFSSWSDHWRFVLDLGEAEQRRQ